MERNKRNLGFGEGKQCVVSGERYRGSGEGYGDLFATIAIFEQQKHGFRG